MPVEPKIRPYCRVEIDDIIHVTWRRLGSTMSWRTFCELKFRGPDTMPLPYDKAHRPTCLLCIVEMEEDF